MIRKVNDEPKWDSRRGDFVDLVQKDIEEIRIDLTEEEIGSASKLEWKKYVKEKVNSAALECLTKTNSTKTKTKHIQFHELKLSDYLSQNKNTSLSKTIFEARSGILDIKTWIHGTIQIYYVWSLRKIKETLNMLWLAEHMEKNHWKQIGLKFLETLL